MSKSQNQNIRHSSQEELTKLGAVDVIDYVINAIRTQGIIKVELLEASIANLEFVIKNYGATPIDSKRTSDDVINFSSNDYNNSQVEIVKEQGADVNATDNDVHQELQGTRLEWLEYTIAGEHWEAVKLLLEGAEGKIGFLSNKALCQVVSANQLDILKLLIEQGGVDVNAKDGDGRTILHHVVKTGKLDMTKLLLDNGADIDAIDRLDNTCLDYAAQGHQEKLFQLLINCGANVNAIVENTIANEGTNSVLAGEVHHSDAEL
ncbi:MAG: ankyrin repeat domain-containing protein [Rickettsia endosymbiont of Labidopullus appendiculatus]|nr:ankyrin repeat domain-containing protein [Rickettsia endosymbiont of Labidopullus appendiculatus]